LSERSSHDESAAGEESQFVIDTEEGTMLLDGKTAVIWGGGGAIGGAVARAFAREGAHVFLAGRTQPPLDAVAGDIAAAGGRVETALVDALDEAAVDAHAQAVVDAAGGIDVALNAITHGDVQGVPMVEMSLADYVQPIETGLRTTFLTWRAAARHMIAGGRGGVILAFGGSGDPPRGFHLGGLQAGFEVIESMRRQLSAEAGPHGIRVVTLRSGGVPESIDPSASFREAAEVSITGMTMTGRAATLADVGEVAAFVASDRARTMTAATVNVSAGALVD
jgi:NAD(P)-dependent dehydrogenase (short-subunit alcohol dehydrogenase family)